MFARRSLLATPLIHDMIRLGGALVREQRSLHRATREMPRPIPWEWARPRLLPLLAGPRLDPRGEELVRTVMDPGCAVVFGLELGRAFALVDAPVAERWECTAEQIRDVALANLQGRAAALGPEAVTSGTLSGRIVRISRATPWTSSLVLVADELIRLFGSHDQLIAAPGSATLISFEADTPPPVIADIVVDFEMNDPHPLLIDPFALVDGRLVWPG